MILRGRYWEVSAGTTQIRWDDTAPGSRPLTISFDITKTLDREPNKARIEITNLSPSRRQAIEQADEPEIQLVAGYQDDGLHDTIFVGDASDVYTMRSDNGVDFVTVIEAQDGGRSYRTAVITQTFDANIALASVIRGCARAMGVGLGNTSSVAAQADLDAGGSVFADGIALEGQAWRALDMVCRSASLRWSIQNGVLQLRAARRPAETRAVLLSADSGLVGSPARSSADPRTGDVSIDAKSLLIPGIYPGRVVAVRSDTVRGSYMCHAVRYTGETTGQPWYVEATLRDYDEG